MCAEIHWTNWINAAAASFSAFAAWQMWIVSNRSLTLQKLLKVEMKPLVHVWFNGTENLTPKILGGMTIINIGKESLPIRRLRILGNNRQPISFKLLDSTLIKVKQYSPEDLKKYLPNFETDATDFVLTPNDIFRASLQIDSNQLTMEFMYYDNSFKFIEIDTSNLGGKYILTGNENK